jgi:hypothetical protein
MVAHAKQGATEDPGANVCTSITQTMNISDRAVKLGVFADNHETSFAAACMTNEIKHEFLQARDYWMKHVGSECFAGHKFHND